MRVGNLTKLTEYYNKEKKAKQKLEGYHIYKLVVYEGDPNEEYITFLTPAGSKAIDLYLESRQTAGETISAKSPLIRNAFDAVNATQPKPLAPNALHMVLTRLTRSVGIRPKQKEGTRQARHDIMLFHGIRKYVNHALVNAGCDIIAKELLIGHSAPGLEGSYLRLTENELLAEFVKAIPALSLSQEHGLTQQVDQLRIEVADMNALKAAYSELKAQHEKDQEFKQRLAEEIRLQQEVVREIQDIVKEKLREREEKKNNLG